PSLAARAAIVVATFDALGPARDTSIVERALASARASSEPELIGRALVLFAESLSKIGQIDEPRALLGEALVLAENTSLLGRVLVSFARFLAQHGEFVQARELLQRARSVLALSEQPYVLGCARNLEGCVDEIEGQLDQAVRAFEAARALFRRCGSQRMEAAVVGNIGVVRHAQGRLEDARSLTEQALSLAVQSGNGAVQADSLLNLGSWSLTAGQLDRAAQFSSEALVLQQRLGHRRFEGLALANLAMARHGLGELSAARELYQRAIETLHECGETRFELLTRPFFAAVEASLGLIAEARHDFVAARATPSRMDASSLAVVDVLEGVLDLALARGSSDEQRTLRQSAQRRLEAGEQALRDASHGRLPELSFAVFLLRKSLGEPNEHHPLKRQEPGLASSRARLMLGAEARWFCVDEGARVSLSRRGALRKLLLALAEQWAASPGVGLSAQTLFEHGWPGERVLPQAAVNRVYSGIKTLRSLGLGALLQRQDDGYVIDAQAAVIWTDL
ncbi:MAG: tetratricopeptide repeat protein, partial [Polyangiaceae bacterium]